jgi:hypothetical protein
MPHASPVDRDPGDRVLSQAELLRALLARQLLVERPESPLPVALERVAGIQAQYAPSGYVGLWSRVAGLERGQLTAALEDRSVVQATLMRATIHLVSAGDFRLFARATRRARREWFLRVMRKQLEGAGVAPAMARVEALLADGPRRADDLRRALEADGYPRMAWVAAFQLLDLVRVPPSGTWEQRRADLYALADHWLGTRDAVSEEAAREHLVRRYLEGFGPASLADIAGWAGLPPAEIRPVVARMALEAYRDEAGRPLVDVPGSPIPDPDMPVPIRFLPAWDATLLVHARRTQVLPERFRPLVFNTKTPHSVPTFLVDGTVAGTWRYEQGRVRLAPFEPLPRATQRELEAEAVALAAFHAEDPPPSARRDRRRP